MGLLKDLIRNYVQESGGQGKAMIASKKWFKKAKVDSKDNTLVKTSERFKRGKIYTFRYLEPQSIGRLKEWDRNPVVLSLGQDDHKNDIGINLNYLPNALRLKILDKIMSAYASNIENAMRGRNKGNAKSQQQLISLNYDNLAKVLVRLGYKESIRTYKNHLKAEQYVLSYDAWARITFLNVGEIKKGKE